MNNIYTLRFAALTLFLVFFSGYASAKDPVYTGFFNNRAIQGYDTVSYFQGDGTPVKGVDEFQAEWHGATWYFSSADNLAAFTADPERYAPQYGGYCAWAVAQGDLYKGDPQYWSIHEGNLYLNFDMSVQDKWVKDKDGFIQTANGNWPNILN